MKNEFYRKGLRENIYSSIYIYKIISMIVLLIITVVYSVLFFNDKDTILGVNRGGIPLIFFVMGVSLILFIISIILDFYILKRTASIGRRLNKLAYIDKLTGLPNRYSCDLLLDSFSAPERLAKTGFVLLRINNLNTVNKNSGHDNGNFLISEFCSILEDVGSNYGYAGRNGGNEFVILMDGCDSTKADMFLLDLTKRIRGYNELNVGTPLEIAYAKALNCDENKEKVSELVSLGYQRLEASPQILS